MTQLSERSVRALKALAGATRQKPVLPSPYRLRRDAARHLVDHGLATYRSFSPKEGRGGFWLTDAGRDVLARVSGELTQEERR